MRPKHSTISARDLRVLVVDRLVGCLAWSRPRPSVTPTLLIRLLARAAAETRSLFTVGQDALAVPSVETVRKA